MALSMMQRMSIMDGYGRCRCSYCGKFRKESDFPDQPAHAYFGDGKSISGQISVSPACSSCFQDVSRQQNHRINSSKIKQF